MSTEYDASRHSNLAFPAGVSPATWMQVAADGGYPGKFFNEIPMDVKSRLHTTAVVRQNEYNQQQAEQQRVESEYHADVYKRLLEQGMVPEQAKQRAQRAYDEFCSRNRGPTLPKPMALAGRVPPEQSTRHPPATQLPPPPRQQQQTRHVHGVQPSMHPSATQTVPQEQHYPTMYSQQQQPPPPQQQQHPTMYSPQQPPPPQHHQQHHPTTYSPQQPQPPHQQQLPTMYSPQHPPPHHQQQHPTMFSSQQPPPPHQQQHPTMYSPQQQPAPPHQQQQQEWHAPYEDAEYPLPQFPMGVTPAVWFQVAADAGFPNMYFNEVPAGAKHVLRHDAIIAQDKFNRYQVQQERVEAQERIDAQQRADAKYHADMYNHYLQRGMTREEAKWRAQEAYDSLRPSNAGGQPGTQTQPAHPSHPVYHS